MKLPKPNPDNLFNLFFKAIPYIVIAILILLLISLKKDYSAEIGIITEREREIVRENEILQKQNQILTFHIDKALLEREKVIERHYHTKEIINNKLSDYEKHLDNLSSYDSLQWYLSNYRYSSTRSSGN